jgi:hypothetical protein
MDISGHLHKIVVCVDEKGFVPPLVEMATTVMSLIEIACVGYIEMTHKVLEICLGSPDNYMEVIGHEDKGKKMYLIDLKRTTEDL